jgi:hypothetical protein
MNTANQSWRIGNPRSMAVVAFCAMTIASVSSFPAQSQPSKNEQRCWPYESALESTKDTIPIIPDRLLSDRKVALTCLTHILAKLKPTQNDQFGADALNRFLSATSAIRLYIVNAMAKDKRSGETNNIRDFINDFREIDNMDVTQALSFGLRQFNNDARSNALLILGNVIDDTTLCVPLDHLYDPRLDPRGRANLLAIVSVVAPWANAENFDNICRMLAHVGNDKTLSPSTMKALSALRARLDTQTATTNQSKPMTDRTCQDYRARWAGTQLDYKGKRSFELKCTAR